MKYAALVRAVNVGGTGTLTSKSLLACCEEAGLSNAKTLLASGNVVFESALDEARVKAALEKSIGSALGGKADVLVRSHAELAKLLAKNPFPEAAPNQVIVFFLDAPPAKAEVEVKGPDGEEARALGRHVFVHYPKGQGRSRLKLAFSARATGRNLNTVGKLAALTA